MVGYKIESNYCDCHPETCCCDKYKVVDDKDNTIAKFYNIEDAENLIKILNGHHNGK